MSSFRLHASLVFNVVLWGFTFPAITKVLPYLDSVQIATLRFAMVAVFLGGFMVLRPAHRPTLRKGDLRYLLVVGILAVPVSQLTIVYAHNFLSPPLVSVIMSTSPAWAAVFAAMLLSERFDLRQIIGFTIALGGAAIVVLAGSADTEITVHNPWGAALALVTPASWALYTVMSKPLTTRFSPITGVGVALIAGTATLVPFLPHAIAGLADLPAEGWVWLVYMAVGGSIVPYLIWFSALNRLKASQTAAYMFGVPFAALGASWLVLDIVPQALALAGGALVIVGVALTQLVAGVGPRGPRDAAAIRLNDVPSP